MPGLFESLPEAKKRRILEVCIEEFAAHGYRWEILRELADRTADLPRDAVERIIRFAELELDLHLKKPLRYRLFRRALAEDGPGAPRRVREKFEAEAHKYTGELLAEMDTGNLRWDKKRTLDVLLWLLKGFNESFLSRVADNTDIKAVREEYLTELRCYLEVLKTGIYL